MDNKTMQYYRKAEKLMQETDGAMLTYIVDEGEKKAINTLVNDPRDSEEVIQMFRSCFMACKTLLENQEDIPELKGVDATDILIGAILAGEPENVKKCVFTKL